MKILFMTNMYPSASRSYGGLFVKSQYEELLKCKSDSDNFEYFHMPRVITSRIGSLMKYLYAFIRFIPHFYRRYDIVHLHYVFPLFVLAMAYKVIHIETKVIFTWHGSDINNFFNGRFSKWVYRQMCYKKINFTIAVGDDLKAQVEKKLGQHVDAVMCAGVNNNIFYPDPSIPKKYDFLFVGDFMWRKGILQLVEAIKKINSGKYSFCFCGLGELEHEIRSIKNDHVRIELYKDVNQTELRNFYNSARFLIMPSHYEPFGLVASESLFCGTPAIVSSNGGLPNQVTHGKNGFVLSEVTADHIYSMLMKAIELNVKDYNKMANHAMSSNKEYRLDFIAQKTLALYCNLITAFNAEDIKIKHMNDI